LWEVDLSHDLQFQILAQYKDTHAASLVIWGLDVKGCSSAEAITDCKSSPDGTIAFATMGAVTASVPTPTNKAGAGVAGELADDQIVMIAVTLTDDGALDADDIFFMGLRVFGTYDNHDASGLRQKT
jgi:hypothetical protein